MDTVFGVIFMLLILGGLVKLALFVARDAKSRGRNGLSWGVFVFLIPLFAAPLYFFIRESHESTTEEFSRSLAEKPKLGFFAWCFAGGVTFGKIPGSGRGSIGVAVLFAGAAQFLGAASSDSRPAVQSTLVVLGALTGAIAVGLLAWGYSVYSAERDEALKRLETAGKN